MEITLREGGDPPDCAHLEFLPFLIDLYGAEVALLGMQSVVYAFFLLEGISNDPLLDLDVFLSGVMSDGQWDMVASGLRGGGLGVAMVSLT